jgi:hypothetical protein
MTSMELSSVLDRCRRRVTRLALVGSGLAALVSLVTLVVIIAQNRGALSPSDFVRVVGVIAVAGIFIPAWCIWAVHRAQAEGGGLCPNCHASLIRQGDRLLSSGQCVKCGAGIVTS